MEIFWLIIAINSAFIASYLIGKNGFDESYHFLFLPVVALALFIIRRITRKKIEKSSNK